LSAFSHLPLGCRFYTFCVFQLNLFDNLTMEKSNAAPTCGDFSC
jgi:hypothetical protein